MAQRIALTRPPRENERENRARAETHCKSFQVHLERLSETVTQSLKLTVFRNSVKRHDANDHEREHAETDFAGLCGHFAARANSFRRCAYVKSAKRASNDRFRALARWARRKVIPAESESHHPVNHIGVSFRLDSKTGASVTRRARLR